MKLRTRFLKSSAHALFVAIVCWLSTSAQADDWPQWRGPKRDGVWRESGILKSFPSDGLKIRWRAEVGPGYSGVVVAQGRVYVCDCQLGPESVERVLCFNETTGHPLWTYSYPCDYKGLFYGAGPYATPIVNSGKIYVCGPKGHIHCLNTETGEVIWEKDRVKEYNAILPQCGCNSSPLIEGNLLLIMGGGRPDGCVMALNKDTGEEIWSALKDRPGGSSPIAVEAGGKRQVIFWTLDSVASLEPATGKVCWQVPTKVSNDGGALTTPASYKDLVLLVCEKAMLIKLAAEKPTAALVSQTWVRKSVNTFVSPVFQDEHHYYSAYYDDLCCFEVATGKQVWKVHGVSAGHGNAMFQMTPNGQSVFILNEDGNLILARLAPEGYTEIGRAFLLEPTKGTWTPASNRPKIWAQPAYANGHIFARSDKELVCASLEATP
jgi:outer membrane protein assembly factor BamB